MKRQVLLFTDGSKGSIAAADLAFDLATLYGAGIKAFFIIDSKWSNLLGGEWINTSETRMRFYNWFEGEIQAVAAKSLEHIKSLASAKGIPAEAITLAGPVERLIIEQTEKYYFPVLVLPNPKATSPEAEARLKFNLHRLVKRINCPVFIGPK